MFVMVFLRNSWLLTELVKQPPSNDDTNPNHFRGEGEGEPGETGEEKMASDCGVGGKYSQSRKGGGQESTSLHGFHVGEIHLLELIKI